MENISLNIGERKIPLRFRMNQFIEIEENVGNLGEVKELILKGKNRLRNMITVIRILGNAGLKHAGEEPDLTDDWLRDHMRPAEVIQYRLAALAAMAAGWQMETDNSDEEEQDEVLNEIRKKNESTK